MEMNLHAVNWIEIPVLDFERAKAFYSAIFDYTMPSNQMGPNQMGFLLFEQGKGVGGAIVKGPGYAPTPNGPLPYLAAGSDLAAVLARIPAAGGVVLQEKTLVAPGLGYYALFLDCEGNRIALHSRD